MADKKEKIAKTMGTKFGQGKVDKIVKSQKKQEEKKVTKAAKDAVKTAVKTTTKTPKKKKEFTEAELKKRQEIRNRLAKSKKDAGTMKDERPGRGMVTPIARVDSSGKVTGAKTIKAEAATKKGALSGTKLIKRTTATADQAKKMRGKGQAEGGANPLAGKPRSVAEAKKRGEVYFFDKKGTEKIAATAADLKRTGLTLKEYANKFAPKKQTKKKAAALEGFAPSKRGGGVMKKKSYAGGGAMKKKGMAAGGRNTMKKQMMRGGGMGMMKKKMYAGGGAMKKKGYAIGGAMKKKGMKRGGKVMKMRGGGLATRGTNFRIR